MNRDAVLKLMLAAREAGLAAAPNDEDFDPNGPADDGNPFGMAESELTHAVDVTPYLDKKRESLRCHASQVTDTGFFEQMPEDMFRATFGTEWFIKKGGQPPVRPGWLFE
jgi:LmbE family N-acetylglucosaminyl deacetylase